MSNNIFSRLSFLIILMAWVLNGNAQPALQKNGQATQLMVNGKPFLVLGGELHNSSSSSAAYMEPLWQPLKQAHLNTVLAAVSWELFEPIEGQFDFTLVDAMIKYARANKLKLILLWFGSWKNGMSHYAPLWVKQDPKRFPRVILSNGKTSEILSPLGEKTAKADASAFAALMQHIKEADEREQTVIMMQVQNEVGVIGSARDHSAIANAAFVKPIPVSLMQGLQKVSNELQPALKKQWSAQGLKTSGSWQEVFGKNTLSEEAFMAWHYARYINQVAEAGKAVYNIPMFVNAWIVQPQDKKPGDYPSGGPQAHVHDIWRIGAPAVDIHTPDIYLPSFKAITALYHHSWNPLFVPESFGGERGAANAFYAIGNHKAIGYSPFGIDRTTDEKSAKALSDAYHILAQLSPVILDAQSKGHIKAVSLDKVDSMAIIELAGYRLSVSLRANWNGVPQTSKGYGLMIATAADEFIIAGSDIDVRFSPLSAGPRYSGLASVYEGKYVDGKWEAGRLLNGDDIMMSYNIAAEAAAGRTGTGARLKAEPTILKVKLYRFD